MFLTILLHNKPREITTKEVIKKEEIKIIIITIIIIIITKGTIKIIMDLDLTKKLKTITELTKFYFDVLV